MFKFLRSKANFFTAADTNTDMTHVSLDIETLDTGHTAIITEIGITLFSSDTLGESFEYKIQYLDQPRSCSPRTFLWLTNQPELFKRTKDQTGRIPLEEALLDIAKHITKKHYVWGNSPSFDCAILKNAYEQFGIQVPWMYYNERDLRTLLHNVSKKQFPFINTAPHTALGDCRYQAQLIQHMLTMNIL